MTAGVLDKVKTWTKKKTQEEVRETTTETPPTVEDIQAREEPIFTEQIDIKTMLYNMLNQINMNKVSGFYNFAKWEHEDQYLDDCKEFVNRMEILVPDDQFRKDIIVAEREPDEVEIGHAMLAACQRLMIRKEVGMRQKSQIGIFDDDLEELYSHLPEVDEDDDQDELEYEDDYDEGSDL
ncbi:MAG: hypothetical protein ACXADO_00705 [Candidatus Thorarchaeota archaeon]|jgi:hypothetical protein